MLGVTHLGGFGGGVSSVPDVLGTSQGERTLQTSHTVTLASGIVAGDLMLVAFSISSSATVTFPGTWTVLADNTFAGGTRRFVIAYKHATAPETSISVTTSGLANSSYTTWRVVGHANPATYAPSINAAATGNSASPDASSHTPAGGPSNFLFVNIVAADGSVTLASPPANYNVAGVLQSGGSTTNGMIGRWKAPGAENPAAATISASAQWIAHCASIPGY